MESEFIVGVKEECALAIEVPAALMAIKGWAQGDRLAYCPREDGTVSVEKVDESNAERLALCSKSTICRWVA